MSIISKTSFAIKCDGCGDMIHDKDIGYYFETLKDANFMVKINGWVKKSTLHYCNRCLNRLNNK